MSLLSCTWPHEANLLLTASPGQTRTAPTRERNSGGTSEPPQLHAPRLCLSHSPRGDEYVAWPPGAMEVNARLQGQGATSISLEGAR